MTKEFEFLTPGRIVIDGTEIYIDYGDNDSKFRNKDRTDAFYMAKSVGYLQSYEFLNNALGLGDRVHPNILELGIFCGGSAVFIDKLYNPRKLVCIDYMNEPAAALERYIADNATGRICTYYGTNQADRHRLLEILQKEFSDPIDLVIDDASHWYEETRSSFETVFPLMSAGGLYLIEDWTWGHGENANVLWPDKNTLTNLIFLLVMCHCAAPGVISRLFMICGFVVVERGQNQVPESWTLEQYESTRGKRLNLL